MSDSPRLSQRRLFITGASGFLGWHLCRKARLHWQVHGTYCSNPVEMPGIVSHKVNLTDRSEVQHWLQTLQPDAIIHTAALSKPNQCEQNSELSYAVNVLATKFLAEFCKDHNVPLVFTSTEQVFDGRSAPYREMDTPTPINIYGRHKAEAEQLIQQRCDRGVICRMPLMYGPSTPCAESFVQGFLRQLTNGQSLSLFVDEFRSPAYVEDAAAGLLLALETGTGILHLGGPERVSRYEFGLLLAQIFELDPGPIVPCQQSDVAMAAARPADLTTHNERAVAIGYTPRDVRAGLIALKQSLEAAATQ